MHLRKADFIKYFEFDPGIKVWPGFKARTSVGLELLHSIPVK
jgi:hypothetical protein